MAMLIIDGVTVPIAVDSLVLTEPMRVGTVSRAYDGTMRSTVRAVKLGIKCKTRLIDNTLITALRAAVNLGARVGLTGYFGGYYAIATLGDAEVVHTSAGVRYRVPITIEEV